MRSNKELSIVAGILLVAVFWIGYGIIQYERQQSAEYISPAEKKSKDRALMQLNPDVVEYIILQRGGYSALG